MKKVMTIVIVLCVMPTVACSPVENQARDTAAALSGSIVAAQTKYQATCAANAHPIAPNAGALGAPDAKQEICQVINRGISGENALITAVETYCGWSATLPPPDPTAKCVPVKAAQAALEAAINNAAELTIQIKGAL